MLTDTPLSRRDVLALLGAAGLGGLGLRWPAAYSRWGLQLYTVRSLLSRDVPGTLAAVAGIGYREVETFGGRPADVAAFRAGLDAAGLTSPSAHVDINAVNAGLSAQLDASAALGQKWVIVASLPNSMHGADGYKRAAETLSKAAAIAKPAGVRVGYHNHGVDFAPIGDSNGMEVLLQASSADVVIELDVYWTVRAGADPLQFIAKHPGRVKMLHLKDAGPAPELAMRDVGAGTIDWPRLLPRAESAGVEHVFVEHDQPPDALASVRASFEYLSRVGTANGRG